MTRNTIDELPGWARELLASEPIGRLAFVDARGDPRALPVGFAIEDGSFYSAVDSKPKRDPGRELARVRYLRSSPRACLTIDHYETDWSRLAWVQAIGAIEILPAAEHPQALAALVARYPPYRDESPDDVLLRLVPERFACWRAAE